MGPNDPLGSPDANAVSLARGYFPTPLWVGKNPSREMGQNDPRGPADANAVSLARGFFGQRGGKIFHLNSRVGGRKSRGGPAPKNLSFLGSGCRALLFSTPFFPSLFSLFFPFPLLPFFFPFFFPFFSLFPASLTLMATFSSVHEVCRLSFVFERPG